MKQYKRVLVLAAAISLAVGACSNKQAEEEAAAAAAEATRAAAVADALSAATPSLAAVSKVVGWDGNVLKDGSGAYHCMPTPAALAGSGAAPMCMDDEWMKWADAWANRKDYQATRLGISYMLAGDGGASNIDPYATGETPDNQWVVEGPHLMLVVPDAAMLEGIPTDPQNGGPYVMWKGTPYAHVMVPVGN